MTSYAFPTDSATETLNPDPPSLYPYVHYPAFSPQYLRQLLDRLHSLSHGDLAGVLPSLNEPTLYALGAALSLPDPERSVEIAGDLHVRLGEELRFRGGRTMGSDPTGQVRRGRLIQLAATFTTLSVAGVSALQRHTLAGLCPFCRVARFRLFLPSVLWHCFACHRDGALLEFAEQLLETRPGVPSPR